MLPATSPYTPAPAHDGDDIESGARPRRLGRAATWCGAIVVGATGAWSALAVAALVRTPETTLTGRCPDASLWPFLLVASVVSAAPLPLVAARLAGLAMPRVARRAACLGGTWLLLFLGVYAWGAVSFSRDACARDRLGDTSVFRLSRAWIITSTVVLVLTIAILGSGAIKTCPACGCGHSSR